METSPLRSRRPKSARRRIDVQECIRTSELLLVARQSQLPSSDKVQLNFPPRNGINDREKLEFALQPSEITFRSQAAWWLPEIASGRLKSRQRNKRGQKIRVSTLDAYTTAVAYLNEKIGDLTLATFDNGEMKELISTMEADTKEHRQP